jgi:hypothetical protein
VQLVGTKSLNASSVEQGVLAKSLSITSFVSDFRAHWVSKCLGSAPAELNEELDSLLLNAKNRDNLKLNKKLNRPYQRQATSVFY